MPARSAPNGNGNFRVISPGAALEFTGERMTTAISGQIEFEHFHRYCLARDFCDGLDVLDVASGEGYGSAILAGVARSVVGVDIDAGSVAHAQDAYRAENLRFLQGSALDLPVDDASVDVVVSFETLEHLREHARFIAEVRRALRPSGLFIVSTPDRTVYSARGEHFNMFHLLELAESEFGSLLRANFANAVILSQRAMLGSVIATHEDCGPWRSYERRAPEYIEASSGLARAPYLIGLASDAALPPVHSSAYIDQRSVDEVVRNFMRAPGLEAQAVERERERDSARAALMAAELRVAELESKQESARAALTAAELRAAELESERESARAALTAAELRAADSQSERDSARAALAAAELRSAERERERDLARATLTDTNNLAWELTRAYKRPWRPIKYVINYYLLTVLGAVCAPFSARVGARFARSAQKRSPGRFDKFLGGHRGTTESRVSPVPQIAGVPTTANKTEARKVSTSFGPQRPHLINQKPSLWYFIGDTLDWLDAHSQLTGVGRVSTELFFASLQDLAKAKVIPCVLDQNSPQLLEIVGAERLKILTQKSRLTSDERMFENLDPGIPCDHRPEAGDHVFFTGIVWTPTFINLFNNLVHNSVNFSVLVYDIIPIENPDMVGDEYFRTFSNWLATTVDTASVIYVANRYVRDQIIRWALLTGTKIKARIVVITFGLRQIPSSLSRSELATDPQTTRVDLDSFVLSVGTIDKRKNQILLCSIWKSLVDYFGPKAVPQLVLVGRDDLGVATVDPNLSSLFEMGKIVVLERLSDRHVAGLYQSCLFTAFSSTSEGYGLPVAESLQYGKLCLSSDLPAIREHAQDMVWYFDPDNLDAAIGLFVRAIKQPEEREAAEARILREFQPPRWIDTFRVMAKAAEKAEDERVVSVESRRLAPTSPTAAAVEPHKALANARRWCSSEDPVVSILIINWNAAALTRECIRQIWANTEGYKYEIVIVDNGSSPGDADTLRDLGPGVCLLELGCNRFFGEANNIAAEASRGRFLCLLNNDAFVQPGWLPPLIDPFIADPQIGATGPLFLFPDGTIQEAGCAIDSGGYPVRYGRGDKSPSPAILEKKFVDYISAATLVVPRAVFMEAGGFDLAYEPSYYEDVDLCLKIQAFGRRIQYCSESRVIHIEGSAANGDELSEARRIALGDLNRDKLLARWSQYLRARNPGELLILRRNYDAPRYHDRRPQEKSDNAKAAVIYTPYSMTPGGGERYLLTLASVLARDYLVTLVTPHAYSLLRLRNLGQEFDMDLSCLRLATEADFAEGPPPDLMVTIGNHVIPDVPGRGKINVFVCQFPFRMPEASPTRPDRALLENYDAVVVYSEYAATHFRAALSALQLPPLTLRIVNPPVPQIRGDCVKKRRILSVGRFFVGGHAKRHDVLISAFKSIYDKFDEPVELHLAGSSTPAGEHMDYLASLKASVKGYPIHFHVNCSSHELHRLYREAFVYWHGTGIGADLTAEPELAEHFGISIVEAMSAGAIPFALNSGGPREIIEDGETGFLFDSVETMVRLTQEIFSKGERLRAEQIMTAAKRRAQDFTIENFEREIDSLLKELSDS